MLPPPIATHDSSNFQTLLHAADTGRLCLMSAYDRELRKPVALICAVNITGPCDATYEFVPLATLMDGNPYERYLPPEPRQSPPVEKCVTATTESARNPA